MTFSQKIKTLRQKHNLSQADFGKSVGVGQTTVVAWERNGNIPEMPTILRICKKYKLAIGDLLATGNIPDHDHLIKENADLREQVALLKKMLALIEGNSKKRGLAA